MRGIDIKVYYHDWDVGDSLVFVSKEFGYVEYMYDGGSSPLFFNNKKEMILNTWIASNDKQAMKEWNEQASFVFLGYL